jgi:hypothetical protein
MSCLAKFAVKAKKLSIWPQENYVSLKEWRKRRRR